MSNNQDFDVSDAAQSVTMMAFPSFAAALLLIAIWQHSSIISVTSFTPSTSRRLSVGSSTTRLTAQKKKGFAPQPKNEAVESRTSPSLPEVDAVLSASSPATSLTMNAGQIALEKLGITYSVLSASWDPDRSGSALLGWDEFQRNIRTIQEGLVRSRENSILREKLNKLSVGEIRQALQDLEGREEQTTGSTKEVSFQGKLQRDTMEE